MGREDFQNFPMVVTPRPPDRPAADAQGQHALPGWPAGESVVSGIGPKQPAQVGGLPPAARKCPEPPDSRYGGIPTQPCRLQPECRFVDGPGDAAGVHKVSSRGALPAMGGHRLRHQALSHDPNQRALNQIVGNAEVQQAGDGGGGVRWYAGVDSTRWPVRGPPGICIWAASRSRFPRPMIMSGSCAAACGYPWAKVRPISVAPASWVYFRRDHFDRIFHPVQTFSSGRPGISGWNKAWWSYRSRSAGKPRTMRWGRLIMSLPRLFPRRGEAQLGENF